MTHSLTVSKGASFPVIYFVFNGKLSASGQPEKQQERQVKQDCVVNALNVEM